MKDIIDICKKLQNKLSFDNSEGDYFIEKICLSHHESYNAYYKIEKESFFLWIWLRHKEKPFPYFVDVNISEDEIIGIESDDAKLTKLIKNNLNEILNI